MVKNFRVTGIPYIIFGVGEVDSLTELAARYNEHILLITGKSFIRNSAAQKIRKKIISRAKKFSHEIVHGEPSPKPIDDLVNLYRSRGVSLVISVGGGSVMDAGKAISAMLTQEDSVENYLEGIGTKIHNGDKVPFFAVPTTAGTGSEATKNAVLSKQGINGYKRSLRHDRFVPDIALIDPLLMVDLPPEITACTGMDAFTQLVESYTSKTSNPFTDALAFEGLQYIKSYLLPAFHDGKDIAARSGMAFAALASGITLANSGLGVVHGFASSIGGYYNIPHGLICGTLMAEVNHMNIIKLIKESPSDPALNKYEKLATCFLHRKQGGKEVLLMDLVALLYSMTEELKIPKLGYYGIKKEDIEHIVKITQNKSNPAELNASEIKQILLNRI